MLKDDGTEVELKENLDDTDMNLHRLLEGDRRYRDRDRESLGSYGYTEQEFNQEGELEDVGEDSQEGYDTEELMGGTVYEEDPGYDDSSYEE